MCPEIDHLRLVVDNSSSADKSTPRSFASFIKRKCHLPGTPPWDGQFDTAVGPISSKSRANADAPPNERMMSRVAFADDGERVKSDMVDADTIFSGATQNIFNGAAKPRKTDKTVGMSKAEQKRRDRAEQKRQAKVQRLATAARIEKIIADLGEGPTKFAARMGVDYKTFNERRTAKSYTNQQLVSLALNLNLTMDYICALVSEPAPLSEPAPMRDYWSIMRERNTG